jgi:hypothetical protein
MLVMFRVSSVIGNGNKKSVPLSCRMLYCLRQFCVFPAPLSCGRA